MSNQLKFDKFLKNERLRKDGFRSADSEIDTSGIARIVGEISDANTNPGYPAGPNVGDIWLITTNPGTVGGLEVEVGDALIYSLSGWFVLQANLIVDTDPTLASNSDSKVSSQKAVKTFVETLFRRGLNLWQPVTDYLVNDIVLYYDGTINTNQRLYICTNNHTSGLTISSTDFREFSNSIDYVVTELEANAKAGTGSPTDFLFVLNNETIYRFQGSMTDDAYVVDGYYVLSATSNGILPYGFWLAVAGKYVLNNILTIPLYDGTKPYLPGTIVRLVNKRLYMCISETETTPSAIINFGDWMELSDAVIVGNSTDLTLVSYTAEQDDLVYITDKGGFYRFETDSTYIADGNTYIKSLYTHGGTYTNPIFVAISGVYSSVNESNIIYVGKHGSDTNNGKSIGQAKLTFSNAVDTIVGYTGPESLTDINKYSIVCLDSGIYNGKTYALGTYEVPYRENGQLNTSILNVLKVADYINIFAPNAKLIGLLDIGGGSNIVFNEIESNDYLIPSNDMLLGSGVIKRALSYSGKTFISIKTIKSTFHGISTFVQQVNYTDYSLTLDIGEIKIINNDFDSGFGISIYNDGITTYTNPKYIEGNVDKISIICALNKTFYGVYVEEGIANLTIGEIKKEGSGEIIGVSSVANSNISLVSTSIDSAKLFELGVGGNNAELYINCNNVTYTTYTITGARTGQVLNIYSNKLIFNEGLKTTETHPTNYKSIYVNTDTGKVYSQDVPTSSGGITEFDATVGGTGGADYTTLKAAIDAGKTSILVISPTTETADITLGTLTYIKGLSKGVNRLNDTTNAIDMGNFRFIGTLKKIKLEDIKFIYNFSSAKVLFDGAVFSDIQMINCRINNSSSVNGTYAIQTNDTTKICNVNIKGLQLNISNNISTSGLSIKGSTTNTTNTYLKNVLEDIEITGGGTTTGTVGDFVGCDITNISFYIGSTNGGSIATFRNSNVDGIRAKSDVNGVSPSIFSIANDCNINNFISHYKTNFQLVGSGSNCSNIMLHRDGSILSANAASGYNTITNVYLNTNCILDINTPYITIKNVTSAGSNTEFKFYSGQGVLDGLTFGNNTTTNLLRVRGNGATINNVIGVGTIANDSNDDIVFSNCYTKVGTTIEISAGCDRTIVHGCRTDIAIVDNGTGTILSANSVY